MAKEQLHSDANVSMIDDNQENAQIGIAKKLPHSCLIAERRCGDKTPSRQDFMLSDEGHEAAYIL